MKHSETPAFYTLGQAAKAVGVSKPTISRAIDSGKLSASEKLPNGTYRIQAAELHRVYGVTPRASNDTGTVKHFVTPHETAKDTSALELEIRMLREQLEDARDQRDKWQAMAETNARLLTFQGGDGYAASQPPKAGLWEALVRRIGGHTPGKRPPSSTP